MTHKAGWKHQLRWGHTHRDPPNGLPKILGEWTDREPTIEDFLSVYPDYKLGCGFCHAIEFPYQPVKRRDPEVNRIANARRKATLEANRVRKHYPLLADVLIAEHGLDWKAEEHAARLSLEGSGKPYRIPSRVWQMPTPLLTSNNRPVTSVPPLAKGFTLTTKTESKTCKTNPTRI